MDKAKEISALWSEIKLKIGEMVRLCHEVESHAEVTADAYQRGYEAGLNDAWECARTIFCTSHGKLERIFDLEEDDNGLLWVYHEYTASEAIEKIRQYEQEQEEQIQVGDEVIRHYKSEYAEGDDAPSIFLSEEDGYFRCLAFNGRSIMIAEYPKNQYRKTGRAFPEIAEVLQKMKESDNG